MANSTGQGFGTPRNIAGGAGIFKSSATPHSAIGNTSNLKGYPITISGSNQVTFTLNASKTVPVMIWTGNDWFELRESKTYTFVGLSTNTLIDSDGAISTTNAVASTAPYYFYVGIDDAGSLLMYPSLSAPSFVEGPNEGNMLGHPGTARAMFWTYVGYAVATTASTAPVFLAATKIDKTYHFAAQAVATGTTFALVDFSAVLPKHGVTCGGYIQKSAGTIDGGETHQISASSTAAQGGIVAHQGTTAALTKAPFSGLGVLPSGKFYGNAAAAVVSDLATIGVVSVVDLV